MQYCIHQFAERLPRGTTDALVINKLQQHIAISQGSYYNYLKRSRSGNTNNEYMSVQVLDAFAKVFSDLLKEKISISDLIKEECPDTK